MVNISKRKQVVAVHKIAKIRYTTKEMYNLSTERKYPYTLQIYAIRNKFLVFLLQGPFIYDQESNSLIFGDNPDEIPKVKKLGIYFP